MTSSTQRQRTAATGKACPYCNQVMHYLGELHLRPTRDHILPLAQMRWSDDDRARYGHLNVVIVCRRCNHAKKDHTLTEWLKRLVMGLDPRAEHVAAFMESFRARVPALIAYRILNGHMPPLGVALLEERAAHRSGE